jgi:antitoxin component of RelBE/YafQ-DinJ toxin-antitoxin module
VVLDNVGLTDSDAVRILLIRVAKDGALPFDFANDQETHDKGFRAKVREASPRTHYEDDGLVKRLQSEKPELKKSEAPDLFRPGALAGFQLAGARATPNGACGDFVPRGNDRILSVCQMAHVVEIFKATQRAAAVLDNVGLTDSDAGRIVLIRGAKEGALPFDFAIDPEMRDKCFKANVREALVDPREATF